MPVLPGTILLPLCVDEIVEKHKSPMLQPKPSTCTYIQCTLAAKRSDQGVIWSNLMQATQAHNKRVLSVLPRHPPHTTTHTTWSQLFNRHTLQGLAWYAEDSQSHDQTCVTALYWPVLILGCVNAERGSHCVCAQEASQFDVLQQFDVLLPSISACV